MSQEEKLAAAEKEAAAQAVRDELAAFLCSGEVVIALIEGDGCVAAIREVYQRAARHDLQVEKLDDRNLEELENLFLPGMLLKVTRK